MLFYYQLESILVVNQKKKKKKRSRPPPNKKHTNQKKNPLYLFEVRPPKLSRYAGLRIEPVAREPVLAQSVLTIP